MRKDEFEELIRKEFGQKPPDNEEPEEEEGGLSVTKMDILKMSISLSKADLIICRVGQGAVKNDQTDTAIDCMLVLRGLEMVRTKLVDPLLKEIKKRDEEREQNDKP